MKKKNNAGKKTSGGVYIIAAVVFLITYIIISNTIFKDPCESEEGLDRDICYAVASKSISPREMNNRAVLCDKAGNQIVREACFFEIVHDRLVEYYSNTRTVEQDYSLIFEGGVSICNRIAEDRLRTVCIGELSRPFLFRQVK